MDNRIVHDPHLEVIPDHAAPTYGILRNTVENQMTIEQALQALDNSWTMGHDTRIQAWDHQASDVLGLKALALARLWAAQASPNLEPGQKPKRGLGSARLWPRPGLWTHCNGKKYINSLNVLII